MDWPSRKVIRWKPGSSEIDSVGVAQKAPGGRPIQTAVDAARRSLMSVAVSHHLDVATDRRELDIGAGRSPKSACPLGIRDQPLLENPDRMLELVDLDAVLVQHARRTDIVRR